MRLAYTLPCLSGVGRMTVVEVPLAGEPTSTLQQPDRLAVRPDLPEEAVFGSRPEVEVVTLGQAPPALPESVQRFRSSADRPMRRNRRQTHGGAGTWGSGRKHVPSPS